MGYYTDFQLTMVKNEVDSDNVLSKQAELNAKSGYVLNLDGRSDSWKWYDHEVRPTIELPVPDLTEYN